MTTIDGEPSPHNDGERSETGSPGAGGFLGFTEFAERHRKNLGGSIGSRPRSQRTRSKASRNERTLFDFLPTTPATDVPQAPEEPPPVPSLPAVVEEPIPPDPAADASKHPGPNASITIASGEKAKARDILGAIRILKAVEEQGRPATPEERQALGRFAGFGPVALSIFPNPVTGRYRDASWQDIGEELVALLTPEEYESAKRTTFNAFYTSPTVIAAMHDAIGRLGVPGNALILEPGCGSGNFLSLGRPGLRFIGIELDGISGRIARARHPGHDIRIENFRDSHLPEGSIDGVIGNVPFADMKIEYRGMKLSLHDFFLAKSVDALKPHGVLALITTHFTLDKLCGAPHNLSSVALSVMWSCLRFPRLSSHFVVFCAT